MHSVTLHHGENNIFDLPALFSDSLPCTRDAFLLKDTATTLSGSLLHIDSVNIKVVCGSLVKPVIKCLRVLSPATFVLFFFSRRGGRSHFYFS